MLGSVVEPPADCSLDTGGDWRGRTAWPDPATLPLHAPGECWWTLWQDFYVNISTLSPNYLISFRVLKFQSLIFNCVFEAFSNALLHTSVEDFICNLLYLLGLRITADIAEGPPSFPVCSVECPGTAPPSRRYRSRSQAVVSSRAQGQHTASHWPLSTRCHHHTSDNIHLTIIHRHAVRLSISKL